jgi:hypothetical protein
MADPAPGGQKHFHEKWTFQAAVAVVGLLAGIWALVGAPKPWDVAGEITAKAPLPLKNTEIILDASAHMGDPFGRVTKLDIAAVAAGQWAVSGDEAGLALRRVGGSCGEPGQALVDFGKGHSDEVREAALEQDPAGKSNLAAAVRAAVAEFGDARFHQPGADNQVMVFVGGKDECGGVPGQDIRDELEQSNVKTVFRFFALKVSKGTMKSLEAMKRQLSPVAKVEVRKANTLKQVYTAVKEVKEEEAQEEASEPQTIGSEPQASPRGVEPEPSPEAESGSPSEQEEEAEGESTEEAGGESTEEAEVEPEEEEAPEAAEEPPSEAEPLEPAGEAGKAAPEEAAPPPRKRLLSIFGRRPMTLSWTLRPNERTPREMPLLSF